MKLVLLGFIPDVYSPFDRSLPFQVNSLYYASIGDGKEGIKSFLEKREPKFAKKFSSEMPNFYPWWQ
jgi:hypothetical protein